MTTITRKRVNLASNISKKMEEISKASVSVGWFEDSKYDDNTPVAMIASQNEFGNPEKNIPPRSFMRSTKNEKGKEWNSNMKKVVNSVVDKDKDLKDGLELFGMSVSGDISQKITEIQSPTLDEKTIKSRKRRKTRKDSGFEIEKPLIDEGIMLNTLSSHTDMGD